MKGGDGKVGMAKGGYGTGSVCKLHYRVIASIKDTGHVGFRNIWVVEMDFKYLWACSEF